MSGITTARTRALSVIASYGTGNDKHLRRLIEEYLSMSINVHVVVLSNFRKQVPDGVELIVVPRRRNPWTSTGASTLKRSFRLLKGQYRDWLPHPDLPFAHRQMFAGRVNDYDLFLYSEDDTLLTERNLGAFMSLSAVLPADEIPGFLRFERGPRGELNYPDVHGPFHWDVASVRKRDKHTLAFFTNEHTACYAVTRSQLRRAIDSGGFLVGAHGGKYDVICTAGTDIYTQCGFQKLLCVSELDDFLIHHLPNRYVGTEFGVNDAELRGQVDRLLRIGEAGDQCMPLLQTETKLPYLSHSKGYYEPARAELMAEFPHGARTVLSIGSGWGAAEAYLAARGLRVSAVPLDAVVSSGAETGGVEVVTGNFEQARRKLEGRQFDCLLLSNVLHLVPNPVRLLSSFASLLSPEGMAIAVVPNTSRLERSWSALRGRPAGDVDVYGTSGVQRTSRDTICSWFGSAGLRIENLKQIVRPRAQKVGRLTRGMLDPWLAYEFIVAARKGTGAEVAR
jgi:2-polyprenyl-3-methyl-5-hydroxy-6-metoxy-1,4-benzoquinol methylase